MNELMGFEFEGGYMPKHPTFIKIKKPHIENHKSEQKESRN